MLLWDWFRKNSKSRSVLTSAAFLGNTHQNQLKNDKWILSWQVIIGFLEDAQMLLVLILAKAIRDIPIYMLQTQTPCCHEYHSNKEYWRWSLPIPNTYILWFNQINTLQGKGTDQVLSLFSHPRCEFEKKGLWILQMSDSTIRFVNVYDCDSSVR